MQVLLLATLGGSAVRGDDLPGPYPALAPPDPGATVSALADATANEGGPTGPFLGLASPIQVDPLFGTATIAIPIKLPPGRKGLTPDLTIRYSSNGANRLFGVGWDLPLGSITRDTSRGVPLAEPTSPATYSDAHGFILTFRGGTILLDTCQDPNPPCEYWSASSEDQWLNAHFDRTNNLWRVKDKNGITYSYGAVSSAQAGWAVGPSFQQYTFGWYLTDIEDPNGNTIHVTYRSGNQPQVVPEPLQIDYGGNAGAGITDIFHVDFTYDQSPRPDVSLNFRGGFNEQTRSRISAIAISVDSAPTNPIRQYTFTYTQAATGVSRLSSVSEALADGTTPPPPTTFTYSDGPNGFSQTPTSLHFPSGAPPQQTHIVTFSALNGIRTGFLDVDGDGLPDLLDGDCVNGPGMRAYRNRGDGTFEKETGDSGAWTQLLYSESWGCQWIVTQLVRLIDLDGDTLPDVVSCDPSYGSETCQWLAYRNSGDRRIRTGALDASPASWLSTDGTASAAANLRSTLRR
jgi:hypothetical protein